jgi:hypothetical protein
VVRGGQQTVSEEKALRKLYQTLNEWKIHQYISVPKLSLLVDLQQKVGELVLSITYCPTTINLENVLIHHHHLHHLRFVHSTVVFLHPKLSFAICLCLCL